MRVCVLSRFSHVWLFVTLWTIAHQAPLSMGFFRQHYWSVLPFPPPGDLPDPGIEPTTLMSPALAGGFLSSSTTLETDKIIIFKPTRSYRFCLLSVSQLCSLLPCVAPWSSLARFGIDCQPPNWSRPLPAHPKAKTWSWHSLSKTFSCFYCQKALCSKFQLLEYYLFIFPYTHTMYMIIYLFLFKST